mgnify:CR=1 FL=1
MVKLVIKGKVIELISVLHLSVEESYVVYYDCEDGEDHTLHFGEDDLDELIIKRPDVPENNIAPAAVQQQEQC